MTDASTKMTLLRSTDYRVTTKTHRRQDDGTWQSTSYEAGTWFVPSYGQLASIDDIWEALDAMRTIPEWFVIRGDVIPNAPEQIRRTYKQADSHILDVDKRWLCIDIDGQPADPSRCHVEQAVKLLPDWLQVADCVWQFSASHGVKPSNQLRLHLWFWLARPVGNNALRAWAKPMPIDGALYQPVQPHYIGDPMFVNGHDPIKQRLGLRQADQREAVPPAELMTTAEWDRHLTEKQEERIQRERLRLSLVPATRDTEFDLARRYQRIIGEELETLRRTGEGGRHHQIWKAAMSIAKFSAASDDCRKARPDLEAVAVAVLPDARRVEALRRVEEGWQFGLDHPEALVRPRDVLDVKAITDFWNGDEAPRVTSRRPLEIKL